MICPYCGWEAKEVKLKGQYLNGGYTCNNATCEMCNVVFTVHIIGVIANGSNNTNNNGSN